MNSGKSDNRRTRPKIDALEKLLSMNEEQIEAIGGINSTLIDVLNLKCVSSTLDILSSPDYFLMDLF